MNASCTPVWSGTVQGHIVYESPAPARVAELVDATDSKSVVREDVGVRVPPWVHRRNEQKRPASAVRGVPRFPEFGF